MGILSTIVDITENIATPPKLQRNKILRMQECEYCPRYNQQDSDDCKMCHELTHYTNMIPIYAIMQKAGEKGVEWGIDWLLAQFSDYDRAKIKREFYARYNQPHQGGVWL
jgi:hypothetical protein